MSDVKEVVNALEMSYKYSNVDEDNTLVPQRIVLNAIDMLKEQEVVEPREQEETRTWIVCGNCSQHLIRKWLWCPYCGRKVKWDAETST